MSKVTVDAGICGFTAIIKAAKIKEGGGGVGVEVFCPCEMVKRLSKELRDLEFGTKAFYGISDSVVYQLASKHIGHVACPVPSAILKAIEVELELALPKDVSMKIVK